MSVTQINAKQNSLLFSATDTTDWYENNMTDYKPILEGFLYRGETMLFYGASGSGKSLFVYGLCSALANGSDEFLGIPKAKNQSVLYVDGEMAINSIGERSSLFSQPEKIAYTACTRLADKGHFVDFTDEDQATELYELVKLKKYDVVVLDSVRTLFDLTDENLASSWRPVSDLILRLRALNCTVIMIHHSTKDAYTSENVTWSGSTNAVTVFDRTCGIQRVGDKAWSLAPGFKEGRSGDGWSEEIEELTFTVATDGTSGFELFDAYSSQSQAIDEYLNWLGPNITLPIRDRLRELNRLLHLGKGSKLNTSNVWEASRPVFNSWTESENGRPQLDDAKAFTDLLNGDSAPFTEYLNAITPEFEESF